MLARRMGRVGPSAIMELIKRTAGSNYISFASGLPDPRLYPVDTIAQLAADVLREDGQAALQYGPAEGYPPLREWTARMVSTRGFAARPEEVLITSGSQQALDLAARCFLDPGDRVAIEAPSYLAAIQAFDSYQAEYVPMATDDKGLQPEALETALADRPRLLYLLPNFQNPSGRTLACGRRERVAKLAADAGCALLEDDAYYDLRYEGEALPPLRGLAANPASVYLGTYSKSVAPGLRVGFLVADAPLVERLGQLKQITDLHTGSLTQRILYRYCAEGLLEPGVERLRIAYRARRDAMLAALERHASGLLEWTRPLGGMFIWARLRDGGDAAALLERAMTAGVVFVPGAGFFPCGGGEETLRLNFVSADEAAIEEGIRRLAAVISGRR